MRNLVILLAGVILFASCNVSYDKTKSGLRYKIVEGKGGQKLKVGDLIKFNQEISIPERDTILRTTYGKMPGYIKIDSGIRAAYSFLEVLPMCSVGDSVVIVFSVDTLIKKQMLPVNDYDNVFRRGGTITCKMRILKLYANEAELSADAEKDRKEEMDRAMKEIQEKSKAEIKELEAYLQKNNIKTTKTPSGAYVEIQNLGTGPVGDTGATAKVFYTGKLLKEGTAFDSNVDPKFGHTDAYPVPLGLGGNVKGFDEGLMYFGKGGKGRIFIPPYLGFGPEGRPPVIPGNATLVFEVELRDIIPNPNKAGATPAK